jgi:hypothetical protein
MLINEVLQTKFYDTVRANLYASMADWTKYYLAGMKANTKWFDLKKQQESMPQENLHSQMYEVIINKISAMKKNPQQYKMLIQNFAAMIEESLRLSTIQIVELNYGKIDPYQHYTDKHINFDQLRELKNLYYLQHIIIHLDIDDAKNGGGHFHPSPKIGNYYNNYAQKYINPRTDKFVAIKLYVSPNDLFATLSEQLTHAVQLQLYGKYFGSYKATEKFTNQLLGTFSHEFTHLEQSIRKKGEYHPGTSYTFNQETPKPLAQELDDTDPTYNTFKDFKPGKKGHPMRLGDTEYTMGQYIEYLGTSHEIEAFARGIAASILNNIYDNITHYYHGDDRFAQQNRINRSIDDAIKTLSTDIYYDGVWLDQYRSYMANKIGTPSAAEYSRNPRKVNMGYRKVWTKLLRKTVETLLAHKFNIPAEHRNQEEHRPIHSRHLTTPRDPNRLH